jgi:hypothetical protein
VTLSSFRGKGRSPVQLSRGDVVLDAPVRGALADTPNAPARYTPIVDQPFDELLFTDPGVRWLNGAGYPTPREGSVSIVRDASGPRSPGGGLRWIYNVGFDSNNAPGYRSCDFGENYSALYTCLWLRPSASWEDHLSSVNKLFYWTARNTDGASGTSFLSLSYEGGRSPAAFRFITQNPGEDQIIYTTRGFTPRLSEFHRVECLQERTAGIRGRVRLWCANESDPRAVLALDVSDVQLTDARQAQLAFRGIELHPYWGGAGGRATREFTLDMDHLIIAGAPE